jgi:elongation factor P
VGIHVSDVNALSNLFTSLGLILSTFFLNSPWLKDLELLEEGTTMIPATQIKKGMVIIHNGELHQVVSFHHVTPGNWRGMVQTKLRNLKTGSIIENRFRSEDRIDRATLEQHEMEYLYQDGDQFCFMNTETYEQVFLNKDTLEETLPFLKPNTKIAVDFYEGQAINIDLPMTVVLEVVETEPGIKGATATRTTKPATLETGLVVQVPVFIDRGDVIRVDTSDKKYIERSNK